ENENQTLATVTFQNYFRMFEKLAGMTGTADTEAQEFKKIYNLDVIVVPTNMPMIRTDYPDVIYMTEREKFKAIVSEIKELNKTGKPVLVGTISIEKSEKLGKMLTKAGIIHHVLNAKHHEKEAEIIAQAGRASAVTISTNMAGRGTDIILGGNPEFLIATGKSKEISEQNYIKLVSETKKIHEEEKKRVIESGGLHILGTERHESRRIDNQLRGRSGRQGDPGSSRFYLSLEDDLLRIFGSERISSIMDRIGMDEGQPIEHNLVSKAIENAQKKVEGHNFDIRKSLLEYDDVMNMQREVVYSQRKMVLTENDIYETIIDIAEEVLEDTFTEIIDSKLPSSEWDLKHLNDSLYKQFSIHFALTPTRIDKLSKEEIINMAFSQIKDEYHKKDELFGADTMRQLEKVIYLQFLDHHWKFHLLDIDHLKEGIGLRGYGQRNPLQEYQREAYVMFLDMVKRAKRDTLEMLFRVQVETEEDVSKLEKKRSQKMYLHRGRGNGTQEKPSTVKRDTKKIGRNEPCPCGSGKKYKRCCGVI
ncbi:MAG: SEC-C metal-binding domain-containing protein, partial [Thermodesulfobacteriota bacterium]|nr:SEC-C metal-binding domain-containing protein [Thermodesulfobacteriota bacterium]